MTRIVAGVAGGRRLEVPRTGATRPTSDRAREGLFSALEAARGSLVGARVLDLYAGSGALGLEASSRGADHVLLVESDARVLRTLRRNVATVGVAGAAVRAERVERLAVTPPPGGPYDVCLADPPYAEPAARVAGVLAALRQEWLAADALIVVERSSHDPEWAWPEGFTGLRSRRYGDSTLWYGRRS